jgi:hypothetical protein
MLVLPHRAGYWSSGSLDREVTFGDEIASLFRSLHEGFSEAMYDAGEAGNCFAFARFTACVYHLMRVAEYGLVSVATALGVPDEKTAKGWDGSIRGIESAIKAITSTKPTDDWQDRVKTYSDLCSWFTTIKTGWRNPVSHIPRMYSEETARGMFSAVTILFEHLREQGFRQARMPPEPVAPPND